MKPDPSQQHAIELGFTSPLCIITGGPGTGKSTTCRVLLDRFDAEGITYALASPTGKAARRLSEATGRAASTIHRLLGWTFHGWTFNAENPLGVDVVLIDEASMLDVELAEALVAACPHSRLIFVGDADQLPSVGPGRVLADLVESGAVPVARLTQVHRAAAKSWICRNAPRVLAGQPLELAPCDDFQFYEAEDVASASRIVRELVKRPELRGAQVLAPQRNTDAGVEALNAAMQVELNPPDAFKPEWKLGERVLRQGDRVIQTLNAYGIGVFNGEVGTVLEIGEKHMLVDFVDRQVSYTREDALNLDLAYALTVHKSQGSEFAWVVCIVHSAHTYMLTRQLFYTAITRAKKGVILVGNEQGLRVATSAKLPPKRNTSLVERMQEFAAESENDNAEAVEPPAAANGDFSW